MRFSILGYQEYSGAFKAFRLYIYIYIYKFQTRQGSQAVKMSTGWLYLKPQLGDQKQGSEDSSKGNTDQQNSNSSKSPSVSTKTLQPKKKGKGGRGNDFNIVGNNILRG